MSGYRLGVAVQQACSSRQPSLRFAPACLRLNAGVGHPLIELQQPLLLDWNSGKWSLVLWLGGASHGRYPFRSAIFQIEEILGGSAHAWHTLPREERDEDFVEGEFHWLGRELILYFEHALGYMQLSSAAHADIQALYDALLSNPAFQRTASGGR